MKKMIFKLVGALSLLLMFLTGCTNKIAVLNPQGPVAREEYRLIIWSTILVGLILAVVIILFIYMLVRFGRKNHNHYEPENDGNTKLEITWTVIPIIIVILLAVPTVRVLWNLENPPKAEAASVKPLTIEVTSVQWKWLFRYPDQKIETVNYAAIPEDTCKVCPACP
ncbi:cytochrome c oxidase subunit II transmembrane domain-containing protein [Terrilactibacillus sp. S3-3]|nr:cytochrome c oxidase subunit II transmembrane domain-containing protein [Terrilactibacillus sp. S3-3]